MASARFSGNTDPTVPVAKVYREASYELMEPTAYAYCISWNITLKASLWSILYPLAVDAANRGSVSEEEQSLGFHASYR